MTVVYVVFPKSFCLSFRHSVTFSSVVFVSGHFLTNPWRIFAHLWYASSYHGRSLPEFFNSKNFFIHYITCRDFGGQFCNYFWAPMLHAPIVILTSLNFHIFELEYRLKHSCHKDNANLPTCYIYLPQVIQGENCEWLSCLPSFECIILRAARARFVWKLYMLYGFSP